VDLTAAFQNSDHRFLLHSSSPSKLFQKEACRDEREAARAPACHLIVLGTSLPISASWGLTTVDPSCVPVNIFS